MHGVEDEARGGLTAQQQIEARKNAVDQRQAATTPTRNRYPMPCDVPNPVADKPLAADDVIAVMPLPVAIWPAAKSGRSVRPTKTSFSSVAIRFALP